MDRDTQLIPSKPERPRFVCTCCWFVFDDDRAVTCPEPEGICRSPRPSSGWPALPHRLRPNLVLQELLGRGGMGAVFRAWNTAQGKTVALKVAQRIGTPDMQQQVREMFAQESKHAYFLASYPKHYLSVSNVGIDGDPEQADSVAFLEMEYVELPTLATLLKETPLPPLRVARIGAALAASLVPLHRHRLIHRDLKPGNAFVHEDGQNTTVRLFDFGLCIKEGASPESTSVVHLYPDKNLIPGSDAYMSPEQMDRQPLYAESDIFAVGSILWRLCTRNVPFPAKGDTQTERLQKRRVAVRTMPPRPDAMPEGLYRILAETLHVDPEKRFPAPAGAPRDYTAASGLERALRTFADELMRDRKERTRQAREELARVVSQAETIEGRVKKVANLAEHVKLTRAKLDRLEQELADDETASVDTATGLLVDVRKRVEQLDHEVSDVLSRDKKKSRDKKRSGGWALWVPWAVAAVCLGWVVTQEVAKMRTGQGNSGAAGTTIVRDAVPQVVKTRAMDLNNDTVVAPVEDDVAQPTKPDVLPPEPVHQPEPVPVPVPPKPKCQNVSVTIRFDSLAQVTHGRTVLQDAAKIDVAVNEGDPPLELKYIDADSVGDPTAACKEGQRTIPVDQLIDIETCTAKEFAPIEVCP